MSSIEILFVKFKNKFIFFLGKIQTIVTLFISSVCYPISFFIMFHKVGYNFIVIIKKL